jgi:basic amino acid/polyamine antiporter, APA family
MSDNSVPTLKRALGLPLTVLYGLGTTIGAGIFALVGKVAGEAGMLAPLAFFLASAFAAVSAFSFAELSSRLPKSAGEALYVREGFGWVGLARLVGLAVAAAGIISAAAIAKASVGYLAVFVPLPPALGIAGVVLLLGLLATWGILESVAAAALFTLVETGGLVLVIGLGIGDIGAYPERLSAALAVPDGLAWSGVMAGAFLAFYAFLGFEDMVNVAEEIKGVERTLPRAILLTLALTTVLYVALALVAVSTLTPAALAASTAPLADLYQALTGRTPLLISAVAVFAILNGALIQMIMASRVLYGLAEQGLLPQALSWVHPVTRTPLPATALVVAGILALALLFPIEGLAATTSAVMLLIFACVNAALWRLKGRGPAPAGTYQVPRWVPGLGCLVSFGFLAAALASLWG